MKRTALLVTGLSLLACGGMDMQPQPLPADKLDYAGEWQGANVDLVITPDGFADYEKVGDGTSMSTSIAAPITEWTASGFKVGFGGMLSTEFHVDAPPHDDGGVWKMTVDGVELTRLDEGTPEDYEEPPLVLTPAPG